MSSGATRQPRGGALGIVGAMAKPLSASGRDPRAAGRRRTKGATLRVLTGLAAIVLATPGPALAGGASGQAAQAQDTSQDAQSAPVRTAKERLSSKAADEQRVDNCKVPLERRGPKPRPDDCGAGMPGAGQR
ncbi:MAG: hypothetical protein ACREIR_25555, partial [Geminicoccaceae bacterium]